MKILRLAGFGAALACCGTVPLPAQQPADLAAGVQEKIDALEKLVLRDIPPVPIAPAPTAGSPSTPLPATNAPAHPPSASTETSSGGVPRELMWFYALRNNSLHRDYSNAIGAAHNLAGADSTVDVQTAVSAILPDLEKLQAAQQVEVSARMQGLENRATKAIRSANDPQDLDSIIGEIGRAASDARTGLFGTQRQVAYQRMEAVSRYAKHWQKYLVDRAAGNASAAAGDLSELAAFSDSYQPIPHSELLNRELGATPSAMTPPPSVPSTPAPVAGQPIALHGLDDLPIVLDTLQAMQRSGFNQSLSSLINLLRQLQGVHNACAQQNYGGALQSLNMQMSGGVDTGPPPDSDRTPLAELQRQALALREQLQMQVTLGLLALPDAPVPNFGERPADYLLRLAAVKSKAGDWSGLFHVLTVYQQAGSPFNTQPWLSEDLAGLHAYFVGDKLESVGQHLDAIRFYRQALATLGQYFPAGPAAAKLKDLQVKYPDLYQKALQKPISDAPSSAGMR